MKLYCPECKETFDDVTLTSCPHDDARLFALDNEEQDPLLGAVIDQRFRIEKKIGQGGMGAVYAATQLSVGRQVAVKVLKKELVDREVALERFYRESKLTSELSHPNIVKLIDFGQDRDRDLLYLVMELVSGVNMGDLLEQGRMRVPLALEIVYQVCGALTEPHAQGIIHRDLKPDNMLIVPISDGTIQIKVLDFGIARALEANTQLTATGMVCGTPAYMAPEQAQNQDISAETDLYALGVILYEMLCGVPPFQGQNSLQIMLQHIQIAPKPLSHYIPPSALPDEVEELVHDMLSKDPSGRPKSARDVRTTIEKIKRLYNLEAVRIDPDAPHEHLFDDMILSPLPGLSGNPSQTEALRRETDLERQIGASSYTTDERHQIGLADTSLNTPADAEFVTVPAHTALGRELVADASIQAHRTEPPQLAPLPPILRPDASRVPTPESSRQHVERRTDHAPQSATHTTSSPTESRGIKALAVGVLMLIIVAAFALVALVASGPSRTTQDTQPTADEPITAHTNDAHTLVKQPPTLTALPSDEPDVMDTSDVGKPEPGNDPITSPPEDTSPIKSAVKTEPKKSAIKAKSIKKAEPKKTAAKTIDKPAPSDPPAVEKKDVVVAKKVEPKKVEPKKVEPRKSEPVDKPKTGFGKLFNKKKPAVKKDSTKDHFDKP